MNVYLYFRGKSILYRRHLRIKVNDLFASNSFASKSELISIVTYTVRSLDMLLLCGTIWMLAAITSYEEAIL